MLLQRVFYQGVEWCSITFTTLNGRGVFTEHNWRGYNWEYGAPDTPENDYNELEADAWGILRNSYQHIILSHSHHQTPDTDITQV